MGRKRVNREEKKKTQTRIHTVNTHLETDSTIKQMNNIRNISVSFFFRFFFVFYFSIKYNSSLYTLAFESRILVVRSGNVYFCYELVSLWFCLHFALVFESFRFLFLSQNSQCIYDLGLGFLPFISDVFNISLQYMYRFEFRLVLTSYIGSLSDYFIIINYFYEKMLFISFNPLIFTISQSIYSIADEPIFETHTFIPVELLPLLLHIIFLLNFLFRCVEPFD